MKRLLTCIILVWAAFAGCRKEDDPVFPESADERLNKTLAAYQTALAGSPSGWNAELVTRNGISYKFHFSFNNANRVQMYSDFDLTSATERKESSYRLKALQQPVLMFDTYSYIHYLSDPADSVAGGPAGEGLESDFEFRFDQMAGDSITLVGRFRNAKLVLRKASAQDLQAWQNGNWVSALNFEQVNKNILTYWKRLTVGGRQYEVVVTPSYRTASFVWRDAGGVARSHVTTFSFTAAGLTFVKPLIDGANTITSLSAFAWNNNTSTFNLTVNGNTAATIAGAITPLVPDVNASGRWWLAVAGTGDYWSSPRGFLVNGVHDAFGLRKIPNFYSLMFQAEFDEYQGVQLDLAGFLYLEGQALQLYFGAAFAPPIFTANGRIILRYVGYLGDLPADAEEPFFNTVELFDNPAGFYLVQTGQSSWDMVSASDARSWISWN